VIDLRKYTAVPGLMDMHTHLLSQHSKDPCTEKFFMEDSEYVLRSTVYARLTLLADFTTVRELGDNVVNSVALRRAIREAGSLFLEFTGREIAGDVRWPCGPQQRAEGAISRGSGSGGRCDQWSW